MLSVLKLKTAGFTATASHQQAEKSCWESPTDQVHARPVQPVKGPFQNQQHLHRADGYLDIYLGHVEAKTFIFPKLMCHIEAFILAGVTLHKAALSISPSRDPEHKGLR